MVEKVLQLNREKTLFWTLLGVFFLSVGFYIYFVNMTIHNTVTLENLENKSSQISFNIGTKEFQYINLRNSITVELAYSLGFKDTGVKNYISRVPTPVAVAYLSR